MDGSQGTHDREEQRFGELLSLCWTQELEPEDIQELSDLLLDNAERKGRYIEEVFLRHSLHNWSLSNLGGKNSAASEQESNGLQDGEPVGDALAGKMPTSRSPAVRSAAVAGDWSNSHRRLSASLVLLAASVLFVVGLFTRLLTTQVAVEGGINSVPERVESPALPLRSVAANGSKSLYVAQISELSPGADWESSYGPSDFLLRLADDETLKLRAGVAEIQYYSGAKIYLEGPSVFTFSGHDSGRLESGRLTGEVSKGTFLLTTPTAEVLDLGTAFGLSVGDDTSTEVRVYDGEVRVSTTVDQRNAPKPVNLKKGMGVRVGPSGAMQNFDSPDSDSHYPQSHTELLSRLDGEGELSLVDVFSSFGGPHRRLAGVIDPGTGHWDERPWQYENEAGYVYGSGVFQRTVWHPFLDGVIVPQASGTGVPIDSYGHKIDLPTNSGRTWGAVWSRRRIDLPGMSRLVNDFWARDVATMQVISDRLGLCRDGMLGMHANVCISFDLQAIRDFKQARVLEVHAIVANLDNSEVRFEGIENPPHYYYHSPADFRVYVDGELRASRVGFGIGDGEEAIRVPLNREDRFLCFVSTDHDGNHSFDHVVLIDPSLVLESSDRSTTGHGVDSI